MRRLPLCLLLGLAVQLGACLPTPAPVRWDELDPAALREALAAPTGQVNEDTTLEVAAAIVEDREAYRSVSNFIHGVFLRSAASAGGGWLRPRRAEGSSVYALVACPGADVDTPDTSFAAGHVRLDSPDLSVELLEQASYAGDFLLSFVDCQIGPYTVDGEAPAHYDTVSQALAYEPDITYLDGLEGDEGTIRYPTLITAEQTQVLYMLENEETLVLTWLSLELTLELRGANGTLVCEVTPVLFSADGFTCELP